MKQRIDWIVVVLVVLVAALTTACGTGSSAPVAPSAVAAAAAANAKAGTLTYAFNIYGGRDFDGGGQIAGYLVGAQVAVTTSAGTEVLTAAGPQAKVKASVPSGDTTARVVVTYPGFCPFDQALTLADIDPRGWTLWLYPGCV